jgi:hypothetical protein
MEHGTEAVRLMKQIRATFSATFLMAAPAVLATDALPLYDIGRMCRWQQDVRWTPGYRKPQSTDEYSDCLDRDRRAYNSLQSVWPQLSTETKSVCHAVAATNGPPSYWMMEICVMSEQRRRDENRNPLSIKTQF